MDYLKIGMRIQSAFGEICEIEEINGEWILLRRLDGYRIGSHRSLLSPI